MALCHLSPAQTAYRPPAVGFLSIQSRTIVPRMALCFHCRHRRSIAPAVGFNTSPGCLWTIPGAAVRQDQHTDTRPGCQSPFNTEPGNCTGWLSVGISGRCGIRYRYRRTFVPAVGFNSSPGCLWAITGRCCASGSAQTFYRSPAVGFNSSPAVPSPFAQLRTIAPDGCL